MNITNKVFSDQEFSSSSTNLYKKIFKNPHIKNRFEIFEKLGIEFEYEKNRAILASQDAVAEVARLRRKIQAQPNALLHCGEKITDIIPQNNQFQLHTNKENDQFFDAVVITTGGMFRLFDLNSAEECYQLSIQLGHHITPLSPSLCPLIFQDKDLRTLSGITFEGILKDEVNNVFIQNDILITHFGLSGPAVLDFSACYKSPQITLAFTTIKEHDFITRFNTARSGKQGLRKFLKQFVPERVAAFCIAKSDIQQQFIADMPKKKLQKLCQTLFHYPIPPPQPNSYPASWTTKGGIKLEDINTATLESKIVPHLFFAGEVLDINGLCGGYNISFAAISAQIVADAVLKETKKCRSF